MRRRFALFVLKLLGWKHAGAKPPFDKYVVIAAPHTSNWDLLFMLLFAAMYEIKISYLAKESLFWWPLGPFLRWTGAIAVDRSEAHNLVDQIVEVFKASNGLILAVPAEGTRGHREYWKSGFYYIALGAGVPIVCSGLDYGRKQAGLGLVVQPTGDVKADMDKIRGYYAGMRGLRPENAGPIRLKDEERERAPQTTTQH